MLLRPSCAASGEAPPLQATQRCRAEEPLAVSCLTMTLSRLLTLDLTPALTPTLIMTPSALTSS